MIRTYTAPTATFTPAIWTEVFMSRPVVKKSDGGERNDVLNGTIVSFRKGAKRKKQLTVKGARSKSLQT